MIKAPSLRGLLAFVLSLKKDLISPSFALEKSHALFEFFGAYCDRIVEFLRESPEFLFKVFLRRDVLHREQYDGHCIIYTIYSSRVQKQYLAADAGEIMVNFVVVKKSIFRKDFFQKFP